MTNTKHKQDSHRTGIMRKKPKRNDFNIKQTRDIYIARMVLQMGLAPDFVEKVFNTTPSIVRRAIKRFEEAIELENSPNKMSDEICQFYGGLSDGTSQ